MIIKLKKEDIDKAVKEYVESLFTGSKVGEIVYHRRNKGSNAVLVEAEIIKTKGEEK